MAKLVAYVIASMCQTASATISRQIHCADTKCSVNCHSYDYNLNECLSGTENDSFIRLSCDSSGIHQVRFDGSTTCQGQGTDEYIDVGVCHEDASSAFSYKDFCVDSPTPLPPTPVPPTPVPVTPTPPTPRPATPVPPTPVPPTPVPQTPMPPTPVPLTPMPPTPLVPPPPPSPPSIMPYNVSQGKLCGRDIAKLHVTVEYAKAYCSRNVDCKGFYYQNPDAHAKSKIQTPTPSPSLVLNADGDCPCYFDGAWHGCNTWPGSDVCICGTSGSDWRNPEQCTECPCQDDGQWHICNGVRVRRYPGTCNNQPKPGTKVDVHFQSSWHPCPSSTAIGSNRVPPDSNYTRYRPMYAIETGRTMGTINKTDMVKVGDAMDACIDMNCGSFSYRMDHVVTPADEDPPGKVLVTYFNDVKAVNNSDSNSFSYQPHKDSPHFEELASVTDSLLVV